ncbi:serine/threonine protein kinase [Xenophilus arseniciresistens]|uniref:Serine/threonine protein kinase n=1 Tax=Xenophilus arseniciresistens TaxID=1283306 RepID=A0AAE3NE29_9BURK|nr:serine/threonine protein kinase [Xenophilus arseniciresistens]MDA7419156.1 serine/threonine protein kinase [Xenophilus arseniciresistens]
MNRNARTLTLQGLAAAGLLAAASMAHAQSNPATVPVMKSGEASTQTLAGEPNPTQRPGVGMPADRAAVRADAVMNNRNPATTAVPPAGEASTRVMGQSNATPPVGQLTREEVRQSALHTPRPFGDTGQRPDVPTNPTTYTGTPK